MAQPDTQEPSKTFRGTWEEILAYSDEIPKTSEVELRVFDRKSQQTPVAVHKSYPCRRVSAMGKYADILSLEEFMRRKHEEIGNEDGSHR